MTYYEKNMEAIKSTKHYLYSRINDFSKQTEINKLDNIRFLDTKEETTTMVITYQSSDYRLNSLYYPTKEAKIWVEQFDMKNLGIVAVMFGFGNGIFVRELLKKLQDNILLVYEPSADLFLHVLEEYDISDILISPNISLTVEGINDNEIKNLLSNQISWINLKSQIVCAHPQYENIFQESLETFYKIVLDNNNRAVINKNTDIVISSRIIDNTLKNFMHLCKCNIATDLYGKFDKDVPAIIVAAGPSLDKNIEDLKEAKNKAVIFAVDTAVKYLLSHDIEPDFIVTLDPSKSLNHLSDERCKNIPIFSRIDSRPENIDNNNKRIILYNLEGYVKNIFEKLGRDTGILNSGGSVATGAFSICETMGFERIILVGQDLAYAGDSTHAGGITTDVSGAGQFIEMVEDIYGNPIKTRVDWYVYIRWFEDAVDLFAGEEVIDATEGGAKIHGTTIMTLKEAIDKYCVKTVDCDRIVSKLEPTLKGPELKQVEEFVRNDIADLSDIEVHVQKAKDICDKLLRKYEKSEAETPSSIIKNKELSDINTLIEKKDVYGLLDWDMAAATSNQISDLYVYTEDKKQNKIDTYENAKVIYSAMEDSIHRIKPLLEEGLHSFIQGSDEIKIRKKSM